MKYCWIIPLGHLNSISLFYQCMTDKIFFPEKNAFTLILGLRIRSMRHKNISWHIFTHNFDDNILLSLASTWGKES